MSIPLKQDSKIFYKSNPDEGKQKETDGDKDMAFLRTFEAFERASDLAGASLAMHVHAHDDLLRRWRGRGLLLLPFALPTAALCLLLASISFLLPFIALLFFLLLPAATSLSLLLPSLVLLPLLLPPLPLRLFVLRLLLFLQQAISETILTELAAKN